MTSSEHDPPAQALHRQEISMSVDARAELRSLVDGASTPGQLARRCAERELPHLRALVERGRELVDGGRRFVIVVLPEPSLVSAHAWRSAGVTVIAHLLGRPLPQDGSGALGISVWDRDPTRTMADGARYHQTHEGGSIHTDNVNQPKLWDYLVFGCIARARAGGETILVDALSLHAELEARYPDVLATLRERFTWEYRGIKNDVYTAPVVSYDARGMCRFRYLRPYVEAAHARTGQPLTREQVYAFDVLDALLQESTRQIRFSLQPGEVLLVRDSTILHGRTAFVDHPDAVPVHEARPGDPVKRTMERYWVERVLPGARVPAVAADAAADLADRYQRARLLLSEQMYGAGFQSSGAERLLELTSPHMALEPGDRVLDLGCGTGGTLRYLARRYGAHGTGVDGSADCIAMARETTSAQGIEDVDFIHSDFRELELRTRYHALWTCQSLLYVADKEACLRRVVPHLVPGRTSVLADYCRAEGPLSPAFVDYCADCGFELPTIRELSEIIERAGLRVLEAVDYTEWFVDAMDAELARLDANASELSSHLPPADIEHLRARWTQKIDFCRRGDLRAAYVIAAAPPRA